MNAIVDFIRTKSRNSAGKPLPGPKGLIAPFNSFVAFRADTLKFFRSLDVQYSGPDMKPVAFSVLGQPMYFLTNPTQIKSYLSDHEVFTRNVKNLRAFRIALGRNIVTAPDDEWPEVRKRTAKYFGNKQLARYGDVVVEVLNKHAVPRLTQLATTGEACDLFDEMLSIASLATFMSFLGDDVNDPPRHVYMALNDLFCYVRANTLSVFVLPLWVPTAENRDLNNSRETLRDYVRPRLKTDRDRDTMLGDLIRHYTNAHGQMDTERILDETIANLLGGSETTIALMTFMMYYIVQHEEVEKKLCDEIKSVLGERAPTVQDLRQMPYLLQTVQETLRLRSPGYLSYRYTLKDTELGGYPIRKDAFVFASQFITHQDPRVWKDPAVFRPERFADDSPEAPANRRDEMPFFPFGGGLFFCIGKNYALNEGALMVAVLLQHFKFSPLNGGRTLPDPGVDARLTLRPGAPIRLRVETLPLPAVAKPAVTAG